MKKVLFLATVAVSLVAFASCGAPKTEEVVAEDTTVVVEEVAPVVDTTTVVADSTVVAQ